jgi:DNA (cytosine-5)-methyltransferase 1
MLQSLPHDYKLSGSWAQATKQLGNMWPPVSAEAVYRSCAQTLEAFDHGLIDADEDIDDINVTLIEKGVDIPGSSFASPSLFDAQDSVTASPYRYIKPPVLSDAVPVESSSAWAKRKFKEDDSVDDSDEEIVVSREAKQKQRKVMTSTRERDFWNGYNGTMHDLTGD